MFNVQMIEVLRRRKYRTGAVLAATGTPENRFKMRMKEKRLPISAAEGMGTGNRRSYRLEDIYLLRLAEVLSGPHKLDVVDAVEITRQAMVAGFEVAANGNIGGSLAMFDGSAEGWLEEWRNRDLDAPHLLLARWHPTSGWAIAFAKGWEDLASAIQHRLSKGTVGREAELSAITIVNLTEQLRHVDEVLLMGNIE